MDIEIKEYNEPGYAPVIDYESWRVAVLNACEELYVPNLKTMQKHTLSESPISATMSKKECGTHIRSRMAAVC